MRKFASALLLVGLSLLSLAFAKASGAGEPQSTWATPTVKAIKRVSAIGSAQHEPNFLNNFDCQTATYRLSNSSNMQSGCFTPTAFGLMDSDSDTVIYNGTDEGLPLLPSSAHQILAPWTAALDLIALDPISTGGSYISLYKNPLSSLQDERNILGQLTAKQLTAPPELPLRDSAGQRLIINPQTLAISDGGSWLVAETLTGSFVRINLATLDTVAFAPSYGSQGSPALLKSHVAISESGRFVAIQNDAADSFKIYDLSSCAGLSACLNHDYQPFVRTEINNLQSIRHVRFINDFLLSFEANTASSSNSGVYELAPTASITSLTDYIGLGDSYTSGEGAFDYVSGTDTNDNSCHLSINSYPLLLTKDLFSATGGHSVACSAAEINDVVSTSSNYRGQMRGIASLFELQKSQSTLLESVESNFVPGYIAQHRFVKRWQPRVVTVSIGGNDIGFGDLIQRCVMPHVSLHLSDSTCFNTYEDRVEVLNLIDRTVPRWTALYKQLHAESPASQIYAIGYPDILDDKGNCALNVHLGKSELEFAAELQVYINKGIQKAANQAGLPYVDISKALYSHRLCETVSHNVAVNGLTAGKDRFAFGKESYHPNALGQQLIEQEILRQTHNLSLLATSNPDYPSINLLDVPKSGRTVTNLRPAKVTDHIAKKGSAATINYGSSNLRPNSTYKVRLDGPVGQIIGNAVSDNVGNISTGVILPPNTITGSHTIDITGDDNAGDPVDVTQPIYVPNNDSDTDSDGVPDDTDSCLGITNSHQDVDQDGIDDVCDPLIALPPTQTPQNGTGGSSANPNTTPTNPGSSGAESVANNGPGSFLPTNTVVATFIAGSGPANTATAKPNKQVIVKSTGLSNKTVNPFLGQVKKLEVPTNSRRYSESPDWRNPRVIWWLWLLALPILFWILLVLVIFYLDKIRGKFNLTEQWQIPVQ